MRIQSLHLENFKRFTNLTIKNIPETAKLVLLIGGNGSGKSCVFDAFDWMKKNYTELVPAPKQTSYYRKNVDTPAQTSIRIVGKEALTYRDDTVVIDGGTFDDNAVKPKFFGRSSIRIIPEIMNTANPTLIDSDGDAPVSYIHNDTRFVNDVFRYIEDFDKAVREPIFRDVQADTRKIFREFIEPLNSSLRAIFGENTATTIQVASIQSATPTTPAKPVFRKGEALINYDLLSHGEKQVVILLLNFIVRKKYYEDSIIFIDEMDCHLNTALQFNLLQEIVTKWIPDTAQLWTASHALGFIDYARSSDEAATIDFDLLDFDVPQMLIPMPKGSIEAYDIAIPKHLLGKLLADRRLVFCENKNAILLNCLALPQTLFVGINNSHAVFSSMKHDKSVHGLRDRDFLTDGEIMRLEEHYPNYHILRYYCFENYLYHPDNIAELNIPTFSKEEYIQALTALKNQKRDTLLMSIEYARSGYEEFKNEGKETKDKDINAIARSLASENFEEWYKFFSMKTGVREPLARFNLKEQDLVQTSWFKAQITQILENKK